MQVIFLTLFSLFVVGFSARVSNSEPSDVTNLTIESWGGKHSEAVLKLQYNGWAPASTEYTVEIILPGAMRDYSDMSCQIYSSFKPLPNPEIKFAANRPGFISMTYAYTYDFIHDGAFAYCAYTAPFTPIQSKIGIIVTVNGKNYFRSNTGGIRDFVPLPGTFSSKISYQPSFELPTIFSFSALPAMKTNTTLYIGEVHSSLVTSNGYARFVDISPDEESYCILKYYHTTSGAPTTKTVYYEMDYGNVYFFMPKLSTNVFNAKLECDMIVGLDKVIDKSRMVMASLYQDGPGLSNLDAFAWMNENRP